MWYELRIFVFFKQKLYPALNREPPSALQLFFVIRGSVVSIVAGKIVGVTLLSLIVLLVDHYVITLPHVSMAAMGVFGIALSLFLGIRNNAAYERWWEARKLWGAMIADVRNLGHQAIVFIPAEADREKFLSNAVGFAHWVLVG